MIRILGSVDKTAVTLAIPSLRRYTVHKGRFLELAIVKDSVLTISTTHPVAVGYFIMSTTVKRPSFTFLVPEPLFCSFYIFTTFDTPGIEFKRYLVVLIKSTDIPGLWLDEGEVSFAKTDFKTVPSSKGYVCVWRTLEPGTYVMQHEDRTKRFMPIIYGFNSVTSFAYFTGTRLTPINEKCTKTDTVRYGDEVDNDCDGKIDEENDNSEDDDEDGLIDEDLAWPSPGHTGRSKWSSWEGCEDQCRDPDGLLRRFQKCNDLGPYPYVIPCKGTRYDEKMCPAFERHLCPEWTSWSAWGDCNVYCKSGTHTRTRVCVDRRPKKNDQTFCVGPHEVSQTCFDDTPPDWVKASHCTVPCTANGTIQEDPKGKYAKGQGIIPSVTCLEKSGSNSETSHVWLGYSSFHSVVIVVPVGVLNDVQGFESNSQVTHFRPGYHPYAFRIGPVGNVTIGSWTLRDHSAATDVKLEVDIKDLRLCSKKEMDKQVPLMSVQEDTPVGMCRCLPGYYGASCEGVCSGGPDNTCSNHGMCRVQDGTCLCEWRFTGRTFNDTEHDFSPGYVSKTDEFICDTCTKNFHGKDCSTGHSAIDFVSRFHAAVAFGSEIITLDGATSTLVQPGIYRLFQVAGTTVDVLYMPCLGRHDCRSLRNISVNSEGLNAMIRTDVEGKTFVGLDEKLEWEADKDVFRYKLEWGIDILLATIAGELMVGVTVPPMYSKVAKELKIGGLLGSNDNDWVNDVSDMNSKNYKPEKLTAEVKAKWAKKRFARPLQNENIQMSGGYALNLERSAVLSFQLDLKLVSEFSLDMWIQIPESHKPAPIACNIQDLALGYEIKVVIGNNTFLNTNKGPGYLTTASGVGSTWTYVVINWLHVTGTITLSTRIGKSVTIEKKQFGNVRHLNISTITFGAGNAFVMDYIRLFNKVRYLQKTTELPTYTSELIDNQILAILFDEGKGTSFSAHTKDDLIKVSGILKGEASWTLSNVPVKETITARPLPPIIPNSKAVEECWEELNADPLLAAGCDTSLGAIHQVVLENCIKDRMRTKDKKIMRLSSSALVFYCQIITDFDSCTFESYLDFQCPVESYYRFTSEYLKNTVMGVFLLPIVVAILGFLYYMKSSSEEEANEKGEGGGVKEGKAKVNGGERVGEGGGTEVEEEGDQVVQTDHVQTFSNADFENFTFNVD